MADYSLERIKKLLEKNFGNIGVEIFQTSLSTLKISKNSPPDEIQKLKSELEEKLTRLFGANEAREFFNELDEEITREEKALKSELRIEVDKFFMNKGIPGESDINEQAKDLILKGLNVDESKVTETMRQLSKEKIISALNESIINSEIRSFLDKFQSYTDGDIEDFINYLKKISRLNANDSTVKDMIETERLYRKFNDIGQEDPWQVKICRQYVALMNSSKRNDYRYLSLDDSNIKMLKKIAV